MSHSQDVENCKVSTMREYEKKERDKTKEECTKMNKETEGRLMQNVSKKIRSNQSSTMNDNEQKWKKNKTETN